MPAPRKIAIVEELAAKIRSAAAIYFTDFKGLSAPQATVLRARLRDNQIDYTVVKKTLTRLAAREAGVQGIDDFMVGQMALAFTHKDVSIPARIIREFGKGNQDIPVITGLILEGQPLPAVKAKELANLPAKDILMGQLVSVLQQPMSHLAVTLNDSLSRLIDTLSILGEKKVS